MPWFCGWSLRCEGGWTSWLVLFLALALALAAWRIYRSEPPPGSVWAHRLLAALRSAAAALAVLLLLEPALVLESRQLQRGRIRLILDRSRSMAQQDGEMEMARQLKCMRSLGLLDPDLAAELEHADPARLRFETGAGFQKALASLQVMSRWQRLERGLLDPERGLLGKIRWPHRLELAAWGENFEPLALPEAKDQAGAGLDLPAKLDRSPDFPGTDLAGPLHKIASELEKNPLAAAVLCSDGRHNQGASPLEAARKLGALGIPVFTVGLGSDAEPIDLGIAEVHVPESAFVEDRTEGKLILKISAPPGTVFRAAIVQGDPAGGGTVKELWGRELAAGVAGKVELREVPFEIPEEALPLGRSELEARLEPLPVEVTLLNNRKVFLVTAKKRDLKILLLDGRPRWEHRYLKNLFERDEKAVLSVVTLGVDPEAKGLPRGKELGQFPEEEKELKKFDVIFFGDLPAALFRPEEIEWLVNFVDRRGGGLALVAGRRGHIREYSRTALGPLLPVEFPGENWASGRADFASRLRLTAAGKEAPAVRLATDAGENAGLWEMLRPQTWVAAARALPGVEVWAETEGEAIPVLAARRFGLGKALYAGMDETWRWRFRAGDRYHHRFWSQIVDYLREEAFAGRDRFAALDTDAAVYRPEASAAIRLRLWNAAGAPWEKARAAARILREGKLQAEVPLSEIPGGGGMYTGETPPLPAGRYQAKPRVEGLAEGESTASVPFLVEAEALREDLRLSWDEELLRQIAEASGGKYLREENLDRLPELLAPFSPRVTRIREVPLSRSWLWFAVLTLLLTAEWLIRKRVGLL